MKKIISKIQKRYTSDSVFRLTIHLILLVCGVWIFVLAVLNRFPNFFIFIVSDTDSMRTLLTSIFQGLASFFAIVVSVSFLVSQLAYGSFSPRMMPNFLKNKYFIGIVFLFIGALSLNLFLLSLLSNQTVCLLLPLIVLDLIVSLGALVSVVPASFILLGSAHPLNLGWELVKRFDDRYFAGIPFNGNTEMDECLPLLQSLIVKSIKDADTDYARRLLGSFKEKVLVHLNNDNAVIYAAYFDGFFKKISFVASQENEEKILEQLVFMNEAFEKKVSTSVEYLSDSNTKYEGSFSKNILAIIYLALKNDHGQVLGRAQGAMSRLRDILTKSIPPDDEISGFRTRKHFQEKKTGDIGNDDIHYTNERIFEYVKNTYFGSNINLAFGALASENPDAVHSFISYFFHERYSLMKLDQSKYKEVISDITFTQLYTLTQLSQKSVKSDISIARDVASGIQEARDFFLGVDPKLAEGYIDLLGQLMIGATENETLMSDPTSAFFWAGICLRIYLSEAPVEIPIKLLSSFEKVLAIIKKKQEKSFSPILQKMNEAVCREIAEIRNYKDKGADQSILDKAETILAEYPDIEIKD